MTNTLNITYVKLSWGDQHPDEFYHRRTDGRMGGQSVAEIMKARSDLTDPSNGPLEFSIMRGCIRFQIIKLNSAGIYFCFKHPWTLSRENRAAPGPVCMWEALPSGFCDGRGIAVSTLDSVSSGMHDSRGMLGLTCLGLTLKLPIVC